ncbi:2-C-methyl-D-erythritol 4-phosphate cytidylyltransferase [Zongyangia hominis]|uniref:Bifunctional enzyme IspD/IspF n=1 Tax=Zongyangia hominis TaxID=2763677 RepID=A0A926ECF9_9FIRM|nr:2-C-methyl-D-erythritol 4-phosphate cytidylyltransferase [Zongyangia hominis]MBC8569824.1 2-C-methyl-D-erythritol 2,4-cyclodiphosphate synthase [Zongyangia hominis]
MGEKVTAIVVAAGSASRMEGIDKQWVSVGGIPVLVRSMLAFERHPGIAEIVAVVRESDVEKTRALAREYHIQKLAAVTAGGATRQASVQNGVRAADPTAAYYCIHDGARPLVDGDTITRCLTLAAEKGGCTAAVKVKDTIKVAAEDGSIAYTPDRDTLWLTQTPQVFSAGLYQSALAQAAREGRSFTDDCQLVERMGERVYLAQGSYENIKITTPEDLQVAQAIVSGRGEREDAMMKIGHGYDVHRFIEGRPLILGGVEVPSSRGLLGHSDADVLTHAVMDALLGALALGDIGQHFPDTEERYRGADSCRLLEEVMAMVQKQGYRLGNVDATIVAQAPKLAPFIPAMRARLSALCGVEEGRVSVKATTEEGLGFTGAGEGMAAHAVCLLIPRD